MSKRTPPRPEAAILDEHDDIRGLRRASPLEGPGSASGSGRGRAWKCQTGVAPLPHVGDVRFTSHSFAEHSKTCLGLQAFCTQSAPFDWSSLAKTEPFALPAPSLRCRPFAIARLRGPLSRT